MPTPSPEDQAFEAQLAALRPREDRLDRERLMFLAGQASAAPAMADHQARRQRWPVPASLGALTGGAAAILLMTILPLQTNTEPSIPSSAQPPLASAPQAPPSETIAALAPPAALPPHLARWLNARDPIGVPADDADLLPAEPPLTSRSVKNILSDLAGSGVSS